MTNLAEISDFIIHYSEIIEKELTRNLQSGWNIPQTLLEAMDYSLLGGGKKMRPILLLVATEAVGGNITEALPAACAVEMIHTYSLIHDDLPAMDDDDYRRGKLTNHKMYGEAMAILAGDGLLTHAFYTLTKLSQEGKISAAQTVAIISELAQMAGPSGMVGGQALDMEAATSEIGIKELEELHRRKTGDLIVFSLKAGGRIGNASETQLRSLEKFGYAIGLAFQIQDDVLDVIGDESKLGKAVQSDSKLQKVTYPSLIGIEACQEKIQKLTDEGKAAIVEARLSKPEKLLQLADYLMVRDH